MKIFFPLNNSYLQKMLYLCPLKNISKWAKLANLLIYKLHQ